MEDTSTTWAAAHPQNVRSLNQPLLSLVLRVLEFFRPMRAALKLLSLAPWPGEIVLLVPEGTWRLLEQTLQKDAVSPIFDTRLRQEITKALKTVRRANLNEVQDV